LFIQALLFCASSMQMGNKLN